MNGQCIMCGCDLGTSSAYCEKCGDATIKAAAGESLEDLKTIEAQADRIAALEADNAAYAALIELQHKRVMKADELWQKAHNKPDTWPDLGDLVEWLVGRKAELEAALEEIKKSLETAKHKMSAVLLSPDDLNSWLYILKETDEMEFGDKDANAEFLDAAYQTICAALTRAEAVLKEWS